jgi:hypothetical protein
VKGESELLTKVNGGEAVRLLKDGTRCSHGPRQLCLVGQDVKARSRPSNGDGAEGEAATGFFEGVGR